LENLRAKVVANRSARNLRWLFWGAAAVFFGFIVLGQQRPSYRPTGSWQPEHRPPSQPDYRPPPREQSRDYFPPRPPPTLPPRETSPVDHSEIKPPVGRDLVASRANIRYCLFEKERLNDARSLIYGTTLTDIFNGEIADWNSRCGSYRY